MLKLENVCKTYGRKKKRAVDGLSFEVVSGEVFALVGPKSAGLTTAAKIIAGVTGPDSGIVTVNGKNNAEWPVNCRRYIGYVPEYPRVYRWMSGKEWLDFISNVYGLTKREKQEGMRLCTGLFELDRMTGLFRNYPAELQQRVMLASAMLPDTPLLVMDEPFVPLGEHMRDVLAGECRRRSRNGKAVFFTANTLTEAGLAADRIGLMCGGRLIAVGTEQQLRSRYGEQFAGTDMESVFAAPEWSREV